MKDFFEKEEYSESDINDLITNKIEESLNLDFKASGALSKEPKKKKEISKDVSAMANSEGGIIIYGLTEDHHVASSFSFIDGEEYTKEWLEHVINTNISRRISNIKIVPIRVGDDLKKTIYVVRIPESNLAPHMASNNRFYKRYNFESVPMEQYEVRLLYNLKEKTDLDITKITFKKGSHSGNVGDLVSYDFLINPVIKNVSNAIEDRYKAEITIATAIMDRRSQEYQYNEANYLNFYKGDVHVFSVPNDSPIFQGEEVSVCPIRIRLKKPHFNSPESFIVTVKLYFSNGIKEKSFDLLEILLIDQKEITEDLFRDN